MKLFPSEVPLVIPFLLDGENPCTAVIHSLPICRIEGEQFVPRYTLYMVTYFNESRLERIRRRVMLRDYRPEYDRRTLLVWPMITGENGDWWELDEWVMKGGLLWIEPDNPEIKLVHGHVEDFPYRNIQGRKWPFWEYEPPKEAQSK